MKITDHKLSEGIALTFRVPEGNMKHPLIILCHGFCGIRNVLLPCFANAFTEAGFATITFDYYSAAIFLIPICISFDTAEKRRYATYLILNRRFSFEF